MPQTPENKRLCVSRHPRRLEHIHWNRVSSHRCAIGAVWVAVVAYAALASLTHPFTWPADLVTAVPIAVVGVAISRRTVGRPSIYSGGSTSDEASRDDIEEGSRVEGGSALKSRAKPLGNWWMTWLILVIAVLSWEVYSYAGSPRYEHPTLSVLMNAVDATVPGKALVFALWLALGWFLVSQ